MRRDLTNEQVLQLWLDHRNTKKVIAMTGWRQAEVCAIIAEWRHKFYTKKFRAKRLADEQATVTVKQEQCGCGTPIESFDFLCVECCIRSIDSKLPDSERVANWSMMSKYMQSAVAAKVGA